MRAAIITTCLVALLPCSTLGQNTTNPFQPYTPDPHTVVLYHLDDGAGPVAADASGNGLDATLHGGQWTTAGKFEVAVALDGSAYLSLPETTLLTAPDLTFEAWIYLESSQWCTVIDAAGPDIPTPSGRVLSVDDTGKVWAIAMQAHAGSVIAGSSTLVSLREWTHVAALFSQTEQYVAVAVNGVVENSTFNWPFNAAQFAMVGRALTADDRYLAGRVDEVRISNTVRDLQPVYSTRATWGKVKALWR